jgi:hypothetical protein
MQMHITGYFPVVAIRGEQEMEFEIPARKENLKRKEPENPSLPNPHPQITQRMLPDPARVDVSSINLIEEPVTGLRSLNNTFILSPFLAEDPAREFAIMELSLQQLFDDEKGEDVQDVEHHPQDSEEESDDDDGNEPPERSTRKKHYRRYTFQQKLDYLEDYMEREKKLRSHHQSDHEIARDLAEKHDVVEETGRDWIKKHKADKSFIDRIRSKCISAKTRNGRGISFHKRRRLTYDEDLDFDILDYIFLQLQNSMPVTRQEVKTYAAELIQPHQPKFRASDQWLQLFQQRHGLSLRSPTDKAPQQLSEKWEKQCMSFHEAIMEYKEEFKIEDKYIINMDETPVYHEYLNKKILAPKGQKRVETFKHGKDKKKTSLILAITADGGMLAPAIILDRVTSYKLKCRNRIGLQVYNTPSGWMNEQVMLEWLKDVVYPYVKNNYGILVVDSYGAHCTEIVLNSISKCSKLFLAIIPGGLTSKLQPLDVCINRPFKHLLKIKSAQYYKEVTRGMVLARAKSLARPASPPKTQPGTEIKMRKAPSLNERMIQTEEKKSKPAPKDKKKKKKDESDVSMF